MSFCILYSECPLSEVPLYLTMPYITLAEADRILEKEQNLVAMPGPTLNAKFIEDEVKKVREEK